MTGIGVVITGDRRLEQLFDTFPEVLRPQLRAVIEDETEQLASRVRSAVPRKTGKLASEIATAVQESDSRITGIVHLTGEYAKAGALEYGAHRTITVREHSERLGHVWGLVAALLVDVPSHERHQNLDASRFLRGPFAEMEAEIASHLQEVVDRSTENVNAG
jgi:hypothetical protein